MIKVSIYTIHIFPSKKESQCLVATDFPIITQIPRARISCSQAAKELSHGPEDQKEVRFVSSSFPPFPNVYFLSQLSFLFLFFIINLRLVFFYWWTKWVPAWGYIPAIGAGEEDTLWRCPNIPRIIWRVSYPCHLIGQGMILHKWSFTFWPTVRGCPPLPSELTKYSPQAMSVFSSRIHQCGILTVSRNISKKSICLHTT